MINKNFDQISADQAKQIRQALEKIDTVLGILPTLSSRTLTEEEQHLVDLREQYRKEKNWAEADAIKAQLTAKGIIVKDTPTGPQISFQD